MPLVLDVRNIRPTSCSPGAARLRRRRCVGGKPVALGSLAALRRRAVPAGVARRADLAGPARPRRVRRRQLRLVVAFLRWHDLKEDRDERDRLAAAAAAGRADQEARRARRVPAAGRRAPRPRSTRRCATTCDQLYGIELPETIDLRRAERGRRRSTRELQAQIAAHASRGVELRPARQAADRADPAARAGRGSQQYRRRRGVQPPTRRPARRTPYSATGGRRLSARSGVQIFHDRVAAPAPLPLRERSVRRAGAAPAAWRDRRGRERTPTRSTDGDGNPYRWDVDLCAVTLANFNYRKMSPGPRLRRAARAPSRAERRVRPALLDRAARRSTPRRRRLPLASDRYLVVPADATQAAAVALARSGRSFIIQGPPGTGKSQTITNLIADYVARGKRVLFVCEKRAAIDVVYARLRQQGLDELCCLIHDSQADKKAFVHGLQATPTSAWLAGDDGAGRRRGGERRRLDARPPQLGREVERVRARRSPRRCAAHGARPARPLVACADPLGRRPGAGDAGALPEPRPGRRLPPLVDALVRRAARAPVRRPCSRARPLGWSTPRGR